MEEIILNDTRKEILDLIERFLARRPNLTAEHFGWLAIGDTSLVKRLRDGGDITTRKMDKIYYFIRSTRRKEKTHEDQSQKEAREGGKEGRTARLS